MALAEIFLQTEAIRIQLKSTVAGELAYSDMMKRSREGKTGSISTDELNVAVMDVDSEVTSDLSWKDIKNGLVKSGKWIADKTASIIDGGVRDIKNRGIIDVAGFAARTTVNVARGGYNTGKSYADKKKYEWKGLYYATTGNVEKATENYIKSEKAERNIENEIKKTKKIITKDAKDTITTIIQRNEPKEVLIQMMNT